MVRSLAWCLLLAACGKDVRLGSAPDAASDAAAPPIDGHPDNPFFMGSYALAFVDPAQAMCEGDLVGMEATFESITRAMLDFGNGTVMLEAPTASQLRVSGTPIDAGFGGAALTMMPEPDPPPGEPAIWGGAVEQNFGVGPLSTTNTQRFLGLDSGSASEPQISAVAAALFETESASGSCSVAFVASLTPQ